MVKACRNEGIPEPDFKEAGDEFVVTFTRSAITALLENPEIINERQRKAFEYLKHHPVILTQEYGTMYECTIRTARRDLSALVQLGIVTPTRKGKQWEYSLHESLRTLRTIADNRGHDID
jgi:ATP-dependent DNA helicase RecG